MKEEKKNLTDRQINWLHHVCDFIIEDKLPFWNRSAVTHIRDIIDRGWYSKGDEREFLISIRNDYIKEIDRIKEIYRYGN